MAHRHKPRPFAHRPHVSILDAAFDAIEHIDAGVRYQAPADPANWDWNDLDHLLEVQPTPARRFASATYHTR